MKRFVFRFEAVEKVRRRAERDALKRFAEAQRALKERMDEKAQFERRLGLSLNRREVLSSVPVTVFQLETDFIEGTKVRISNSEAAIDRATRAAQKELDRYLEARKNLRVIEKLREKDYEKFKKLRRKKEERELDDLYVMRSRVGKEIA